MNLLQLKEEMLAAADVDWNAAWSEQDHEGSMQEFLETNMPNTPSADLLFALSLCKRLHRLGWKAGKANTQGKIIGALGIRGVQIG
jgi:hypothetical protein